MENFISSETNNNSTNVENNIKMEHIFVLAGGQLQDGSVNDWVKKRLDLALKIKKKKKRCKNIL